MDKNVSLTDYNIDLSDHNYLDEQIQTLRKRSNRCICKYCGSTLSLHKVTYAAYEEARIEIFCDQCSRIEYGVEPEIFLIAKYFVDEIEYDHYPLLDQSVRKQRMNIAIISDILSWGFKNSGLLTDTGFNIPLDIDKNILSETFIITDRQLQALIKE